MVLLRSTQRTFGHRVPVGPSQPGQALQIRVNRAAPNQAQQNHAVRTADLMIAANTPDVMNEWAPGVSRHRSPTGNVPPDAQ
jgi:hypothetical protein